jgi:uncharacterized protein YqeY
MSGSTRPATQTPATEPPQLLRDRLKADLTSALKARQTSTAMTLRTLLAAIDNAEAVPLSAAPAPINGRSHDVPRKVLGALDIQAILAQEAAECRRALGDYRQLGQGEAADAMRAALTLIETYADWMAHAAQGAVAVQP